MSGWIKLHRKLRSWEWYNDHTTTRLFIHLLLTANRSEKVHRGVTVPTGGLKCGRKQLAIETGLSEQQIRRGISNLQSTDEIAIKATNKYSIITLLKWGEYQSSSDKATSKRADKQPAQQQKNNHKQEEETKEESIYSVDFELFWKSYPKKKGKGGAFRSWELIKKRPNVQLMINAVENEKQTEQWKKSGGQYIPNPQTWINQRRWEDGDIEAIFVPFHQTGKTMHGEPLCDGLTREQFKEKHGRLA